MSLYWDTVRRGAAQNASAPHPRPLPPPDGFKPVDGLPDLHFRWQSAWGGSTLLGTETLAVILFNGGHPLEEVTLAIRGLDAAGREVFTKEQDFPVLPRGREALVEVPSYEVHGPVDEIAVRLVAGRTASEL